MSTPQFEQLRAKAEQGQPESQFLISQICRQNRDLDGMLHWLERASAQNHADAIGALGHCFEKGVAVAKDYDTALQHYERAVNAGSAVAAFQEAELLYKSKQAPDNATLIRARLQAAANAGVLPALRAIGYLALQQASKASLASECLQRAAAAGDPASCFNLGWRWLNDDEKSNAAAAIWLRQAATANYPFADGILQQLQNADTKAPKRAAAAPILLDESFELHPAKQQSTFDALHTDPDVTLFSNVLDMIDCAYLIYSARPYLKRADVIDPDSQGDGMVSDVRTSMSTYLPFDAVDFVSRYIELKILAAVGGELNRSEPMSILCYAVGEYYRPHVDYFNPKLETSKQLLKDGGQRTASAVTYLAAPVSGGGTSFPRLNLEVPAAMGSTLWFRNAADNGEIDERSLHAGDTVTQGEKWVVTKWFRQEATRYLEF